MENLAQKNLFHKKLYNQLADEYKKRTLNVLVQGELWEKAKNLKSYCDEKPDGNFALEIGLGGGMMNKMLSDVGFKTMGIDIAENMIENAKKLNPDGEFLIGNYLETDMQKSYDLIIGLAFIHLFDVAEAKAILAKAYNELADGGILHLTTTKEDDFSYDKYCKEDYGKDFVRYRAKHTPESFVSLMSDLPFKFVNLDVEKASDGKTWMALTAKKF